MILNSQLLAIQAVLLFVSVVLVGANGCASNPNSDEESAAKLYQLGLEDLDDGYHDLAIKTFNKLQTLHPSGAFTENAWLQKAYANLIIDQPVSAQAEVHEFVRNYPNHINMDYALFLRGFSEHAKLKSLINLSINGFSKNDTNPLLLAKRYYGDLLRRFPDSSYSSYAKTFIKDIDESLAEHETIVAQYYANSQLWVASIMRAQYVVAKYPLTESVSKAWQLVEQGYKGLGLDEFSEQVSKHRKIIDSAN